MCAWFRPEVVFLNHEKMEPAVGIFRIPSNSFLKVMLSFYLYIYFKMFFGKKFC